MAPLRLSTLLDDQFRILTFRAPSAAIVTHRRAYLVFGLLTAWFAGIGRYWDHPSARLWQYVGIGSVVYVPMLAGILRLFCSPLARRPLPYRTIVTFVSLTSLPALFYAIPVERFVSADGARAANAWFLAAVAAWRVAMLATFLRRTGGLGWFALSIGTLYPLVFVAALLALLNLEHAAFDIMSGIRNETPYDGAYNVVMNIAGVACASVVPLTLVWSVCVGLEERRRRAAASRGAEPSR